MFKNILVAVDGSEPSKKALSQACSLASQCQSAVHLVNVSNYQQLIVAIGGGAASIPQEVYEKPGKDILKRSALDAEKLGCSVTELHHVQGNTGKAILETAKEIEAGLIVLGSQGHSDVSGLLLGSVSHAVCNSSECSCLVVR